MYVKVRFFNVAQRPTTSFFQKLLLTTLDNVETISTSSLLFYLLTLLTILREICRRTFAKSQKVVKHGKNTAWDGLLLTSSESKLNHFWVKEFQFEDNHGSICPFWVIDCMKQNNYCLIKTKFEALFFKRIYGILLPLK